MFYPPRDPRRTLLARWSPREDDLQFFYPRPPDGHFLHGVFDHWRLPPCVLDLVPDDRSLSQHLDARGYDLTTLLFRIDRKGEP
jgi:hypothetical protein